MRSHLTGLRENQSAAVQQRMGLINNQLKMLISQQRHERKELDNAQDKRWQVETKNRQARYNKGLRGLIDRVTGKYQKLKKQNEHDTYLAMQRDRREKDELIYQHLEQRRVLQRRCERLDSFDQKRDHRIDGDIEQYHNIGKHKQESFEQKKSEHDLPSSRRLER